MNIRHVSGPVMLCLTLCLLCQAPQVFAGEERINKANVPAAVVKACETAYPNATVKGYAKEVEHGKTYYEVETVEGNVTRDLLYKPDGTVEEIEESVTMEGLPDTVSRSFAKAASGAKPSKIEKVTRGANVTYEFGMGKGQSEMVIDASGRVAKKSKAMKQNKEHEETGGED